MESILATITSQRMILFKSEGININLKHYDNIYDRCEMWLVGVTLREITKLKIMGNTKELININYSIKEIMLSTALTASRDKSIHEVCQVIFSQHIGALLIVDENKLLLGLLTRSDLLRTVIKKESMELWI